MSKLNPQKLHVTFKEITEKEKFILPRKYTLTHSDRTGDLFLTIGKNYDLEQISHWYTRFMRDEVLAEWKKQDDSFELHIYVHISGGFIFGWAKIRDKIIRNHLTLVFQALRFGDRNIFINNPNLDHSKIIVYFNSKRKKFHKTENFGHLKNYQI